MVQEGLHHRPQHELLVRPRKPVHAGEVKTGIVDISLQHTANLVLVSAGGTDYGPGVAVEKLRLEEHQVAELQEQSQAVIGQQGHCCLHIGLADCSPGKACSSHWASSEKRSRRISAVARIFKRASFSLANSRGVAVQGRASQGMRSAMSCFSLDGFPSFAPSEQL